MQFNHIGFLVPGNFAEDDPARGLEETLALIELGEALGYSSAWLRQRHLERGVSSAATMLAAASQRTKTIGLGTAVIPLGYENPFRLAEDLATVDVLSGGRLNIGVSANPPAFADLVAPFYDGDLATHDFTHRRAERLAEALASKPLSDRALAGNAAGAQIPRLHPIAKGIETRLWYGGGSLVSADWAGRNGWHLLSGNIVTGEGTDDFLTAQAALIARHRAAWGAPPPPRLGLGRVVLPLDSASFAQRRRYHDFVAERTPRTLSPQGPKRTLFAPDLIGTTDQLFDLLSRDPIVAQAREFRVELPYDFAPEDYRQILGDFAQLFPRLKGTP